MKPGQKFKLTWLFFDKVCCGKSDVQNGSSYWGAACSSPSPRHSIWSPVVDGMKVSTGTQLVGLKKTCPLFSSLLGSIEINDISHGGGNPLKSVVGLLSIHKINVSHCRIVQMKATNPYLSNLLLTILPTWVSVTINFSSAMGPDMSTRCCWRPLKCDIFVIHRTNIASSCLWTAKKVKAGIQQRSSWPVSRRRWQLL